MRKFGTKKSNELAKFELNPLNATMRAAFSENQKQKRLHKIGPACIFSLLAAGSAVWSPNPSDESGKRVFSAFLSSAQATEVNISASSNSPGDFNVTGYTGPTANVAGSVQVSTNASAATDLSKNGYNITVMRGGTTTVNVDHALNSNLTSQNTFGLKLLGGDVESSDFGETVVVNVKAGIYGTTEGLIVSPSSDLDSATIKLNDGHSISASSSSPSIERAGVSVNGNVGIFVLEALNANSSISSGYDGVRVKGIAGYVSIMNDGTISGSEKSGSLEGFGIRISSNWDTDAVSSETSVGNYVLIDNRGLIQGETAGVLVDGVGSASATESETVNITNSGTIQGQSGVVVRRVFEASADAGASSTGDVKITNADGGTIRGFHETNATGLRVDGVDGNVLVVNENGGLIIADTTGASSTVGTAIAINDVEKTVKVQNTGEIVSEGTGYAVEVTNVAQKVELFNYKDGLIRNQSNVTSDMVIRVIQDDNNDEIKSTGNVSVSNAGTIRGAVYLVGNESVSLTVERGGKWLVSGDGGAQNYGFQGVSGLAGGDEVVIRNNGTIEIFGDTNFTGLTKFDNAGGVIDLTTDGSSSSVLTLEFGSLGNTFYGSRTENGAESLVKLDADLSGSVTANNLRGGEDAPRFDQLVIQDEAVGTTKIEINDLAPTAPGVNVRIGETLVTAFDESEDSAFVLKDGPINKGLWQYDLYARDTGNNKEWRLASAPSEHAHELPVMQSAAQEAWHQGAAAWLDHTNNVRMRLEEGNAVKGGAWARVVGADIERKNLNRGTQSEYGTAYSHQNNYEQDIYGVMFGADGAIELANGGTWLLGLTAGVTQSKVNFTTSTTDMDYTAGSVGAYASFVRGGGFFNALLKADMGSTDYKMSNGNGISANESFQTSAFGVMLDGGYRFRSGVAFIEPSVSVASVSAKIKDKEFLATNVDFSNGTSLRTKLTLATGFSAAWGGTHFEPYLALSAVHESDGENEVSLTSGGESAVQVKDKQVETYGQVGLGLKVVGSKGSSGFLKVEHAPSASDNDTTKGDAKREATTVSAGVKLTW